MHRSLQKKQTFFPHLNTLKPTIIFILWCLINYDNCFFFLSWTFFCWSMVTAKAESRIPVVLMANQQRMSALAIMLTLILIICLGIKWWDTPKPLLCKWIHLDLIWPHASLKGNQGPQNFHPPSIDYGSCRDMEKPVPPLPFIGPIKYSSCPNGEIEIIFNELAAAGWDKAQLH